MGGLTADYTVTPGVFYNDNDSVETTLKTHIVAPVFVPEPETWVLLIMGGGDAFRREAARSHHPHLLNLSPPR